MPISDYSYMLRSTGTLSATEGSATGVHTGPGPIDGMKLRIYVPAVSGTNSPTAAIKLQECDDNQTWADVPGGAVPNITAAGTYEFAVRWTKRYIRHHTTISGTNPDFGVTTIGLTPGQIATT